MCSSTSFFDDVEGSGGGRPQAAASGGRSFRGQAVASMGPLGKCLASHFFFAHPAS